MRGGMGCTICALRDQILKYTGNESTMMRWMEYLFTSYSKQLFTSSSLLSD